jgi:ribose transport system ATP-binding protein
MPVIGQALTKAFAGQRVLDGVDIVLASGEVHALLGANGSGKSTLVKILTGVYQPDAGRIHVGERGLTGIDSPHEANALGIAVVHQEAPLIDTMSVAECIAIFRGYPVSTIGRVRWRRLESEAAAMLARFDVRISPRQLAGKLNPAERALVALVIALDRVTAGLALLVLDEVTASLPEDQAAGYLERVAAIAQSGVAVLMVTHRLSELKGLARRVTVLRDGRRVYAAPAGEIGEEGLVAHMVGTRREATARRPVAARPAGAVRRLWSIAGDGQTAKRRREAIAVEHLAGTFLSDVSFGMAPGEIVGVAGLIESGVGELPQVLGGVLPRRAGTIRIAGRELPERLTPREAIDAGVALLPADRLRNGGIATLSLADNAVLPEVGRYWHKPGKEQATLQEMIRLLDIRPPLPRTLFGKLSGGNQQKVLLGKWLLTRPALLVLDDPTSGVDPSAREKIFEILRDAAAEGISILFFSTEPEQLAAMCSRVLVLKAGRVSIELAGAELSRETISHWCYA